MAPQKPASNEGVTVTQLSTVKTWFLCLGSWRVYPLGTTRMLPVFRLEEQIQADGQLVHASAFEAVEGLFRREDDRFILVEAGVEDDGDSRLAFKGSNRSRRRGIASKRGGRREHPPTRSTTPILNRRGKFPRAPATYSSPDSGTETQDKGEGTLYFGTQC